MHFRRLATFLLGLWIGGSLFMTMVATQNFRSVDRQLAAPSPNARDYLSATGAEASRAFLRHFVSEQNRFYFTVWEWTQIGLGLVFVLTLVLGSRESRVAITAALAMLAIVLFFRFFLTPQIVELGRSLDFHAPGDLPEIRSRFWDFHRAYSALEVIKWILGLGLLLKFVLPKRPSREVPDDLDSIEKSYHRHIDR